jgi:hypothetical protein
MCTSLPTTLQRLEKPIKQLKAIILVSYLVEIVHSGQVVTSFGQYCNTFTKCLAYLAEIIN